VPRLVSPLGPRRPLSFALPRLALSFALPRLALSFALPRLALSFVLVGVLVGAFALAPVRAVAAEPALDVRGLEARLRVREPDELAAALREVVRAGDAARPLRPAVEGLALRGLPPALAALALEALGSIGARESAPVVRRYVRHRHAGLRLAAAQALGQVGGPVAVAALRGALDDGDERVRGEAASSLAALGAVEATDDLYRALDRGVPEAAPALGRLCPASACAGLADRLSSQPFARLAPAYEALLFRPASPVPDAQKIALLRRLHDRPAPEVHRFVAEWRERWSGSLAVGDALARAAEATAPPRGN
jgi:hypothetical protein